MRPARAPPARAVVVSIFSVEAGVTRRAAVPVDDGHRRTAGRRPPRRAARAACRRPASPAPVVRRRRRPSPPRSGSATGGGRPRGGQRRGRAAGAPGRAGSPGTGSRARTSGSRGRSGRSQPRPRAQDDEGGGGAPQPPAVATLVGGCEGAATWLPSPSGTSSLLPAPRPAFVVRETNQSRSRSRARSRRGGSAVEFDVLVEIPKGQRNKYEVDHETGRIRLDRMLFTSTQYPADYGFIENTLGLDGDPLDALVLLAGADLPGLPDQVPRDRHVPDDRRGRRRRQGALRARDRPAPGAPARHQPRLEVRPAGDPALLRGLQGPRARQVRRGRQLGRPRRGRGRGRRVVPARQGPTATRCRPRAHRAPRARTDPQDARNSSSSARSISRGTPKASTRYARADASGGTAR